MYTVKIKWEYIPSNPEGRRFLTSAELIQHHLHVPTNTMNKNKGIQLTFILRMTNIYGSAKIKTDT